MIRVVVTSEVGVPAAAAWDYVADFSNNPEWQSGVELTSWTSPLPPRVGSTFDQMVEDQNKTTPYTITAIQPGRSITAESSREATIPTTVTRTVQPLNEGACRLRVDLIARPRGVRRLARPLLRRLIRSSVETDYQRLKELLEESGPH
jgi:hypothetical protein